MNINPDQIVTASGRMKLSHNIDKTGNRYGMLSMLSFAERRGGILNA